MTAIRKHRAPDRVRQLEAANADLRKQLAAHQSAGDRLAESILRGIQDATALAEALARVDELEGLYAQLGEQRDREIEAMQREIDDRDRESDVASRAAAMVTETQPIDSRQVQAVTDPDGQRTEPIYVGLLRQQIAEREREQATHEVKPLAEALGGAA